MTRRNPTIGLLMYYFYSAKGNLQISLLFALATGVALFITGNTIVYNFFVLATMGLPSYIIMIRMGAKNQLQWEKYQISMPIKRKNFTAALYLSVLAALVAGLLLCVVLSSVTFIFNEELLHHVIKTAFETMAYVAGLVLLMFALLVPIGSTKFGESRGEVFFTICMIGAIVISLLISWLANRAELSQVIISLLQVAISAVAFIISYHITTKIYSKIDF